MEFLQHRSKIVSVSIFLLIIFFYFVISRTLHIKRVHYSTDNLFTENSKSLLKSNLLTLVKKRVGASKILEHAKAIVPGVNKATIIYRANQLANLRITAQEPLALLKLKEHKNEFIISKQGNYFDIKFLNNDIVKDLPRIIYSKTIEELKSESYIVKIISDLDSKILNDYKIIWQKQLNYRLIYVLIISYPIHH